MNMTQNIPEIRTRERNDLIQRLIIGLKQDERVIAAWIAGSVARGDEDWLSDIDINIAVADESIEEVVQGRHEFAAQLVTPSLSMDQMRNAPPRGGYLLVHYPGEFGPQHVDWFWQPESLANIPDNGRLLFDKVGLPGIDGKVWEDEMNQTESRPAIDSTDPVDLLTHDVKFFWPMSLIVAKYITRGENETVGHMIELIERTLSRVTDSLGVDDQILTASDAATQDAQFQTLRSKSQQAQSLHVALQERAVVIPTEAITQVEQFFDACESVVLA